MPAGGWPKEGEAAASNVKLHLIATDPGLVATWKSSLHQLLGAEFSVSKAPPGPQERALQKLIDKLRK